MRSLESKIALAPNAARPRRRRDDEDAAEPLTEEPQRQDGRAEAPSTTDEEAGQWTVAAVADTTDTPASDSVQEGSTGGGVLPQAPSLSPAGVGLGIVGLIGTVAVGAGTKTQALPSPKPEPPVKPVEPIAPGVPVEPVEPITPVAPPKPVEPVTPVAPLNPVAPTTPEKPVEPVLPKPTSFSLSNAHVIESTTGTRELVFLVQRSGDTSQSGQVSYSFEVDKDKSTVSKDEAAGPLHGVVSFQAGESQRLIRLPIKGDPLRETDERVSLKLHDPVGGTLGRAEGNGTVHEVDVTRLQAAYGLRDLNTELDGAAIRVRRSSDDKEMDIGFDVHGQLDREALLDFVGRAATDKGYVTRWYDQSGNARDMAAKEPEHQGVIVDGGELVTRADGSVGISFNAGRNGERDDHMIATGLAADDWRSIVIHANVGPGGERDATLFHLGHRLWVDYPSSDQLSLSIVAPFSHVQTVQLADANDMAFEAHVDAAPSTFLNGQTFPSKELLSTEFRTTDNWLIAAFKDDDGNNSYRLTTTYNEFLVYLARDDSTPSVQNLIGTAQDDVLTYSGERDLKRIDGLAGEDTLYVSAPQGLPSDFLGRIKHVEQLWLENGEQDLMLLSPKALMALDVKALTIRLDVDDVVFVGDDEIRREENLRKTLAELVPTMQFTVLIDGQTVL